MLPPPPGLVAGVGEAALGGWNGFSVGSEV